MKKSFLLIAAIACTSLSLFAQTNSTVTTSPVSFGVKAGINLAKQSYSGQGITVSTSTLVGLNAGIFATLHVSEAFGVQPELAWSTLGAKLKSGNNSYKSVANYLTLPVLAKYTIATSGFSLYAGPQIGFLLSAKDKSGSTSVDTKDDYKSTDFAGVAGLEFEIPNTKLNISGRYQFSLSNIAKDMAGDGSVKNNAATFTVGYRIK